MRKSVKTKLFVILFFTFIGLHGQTDWVSYLVNKNKGVLSISANLDFIDGRPNYNNLLIVGTNYQDCLKNGFPVKNGLEKLFAFSDSTEVTINKLTKNELVGILTYQCMGFDVYYVKDTINLRKNLNQVISNHFEGSKNYIILRKDKNWNYYFKNLYPKNVSDAYFTDQKYLIELVYQGDDLTGKRKVNHWAYFNNPKKRERFIKKLKKNEFAIDSINYKKEKRYPYEVQFSRSDFILPNYITNLTQLFQVFVEKYNGVYEGWGTELKVED